MMNTVCFGEILWDILPQEKMPGGAPMNVCYHLNRLGQKAAVISKIGDDENGVEILQFLKARAVDTSFVQVDKKYPTGTVIATQKGNEMEYEIVQPVAWDFIDDTQSAAELVQHADIFIYGSLAARNEHTQKTLYQFLQKAKTKVVDINLRPPHYNQQLLETLLQYADIIKLNNHELELIAAWYGNEKNFEAQVALLSRQFAVSTIVITKGENGASLFFDDQFFHHPGYKVNVANTIGSCDAFLAGFLSKHVQQKSPEEALDFASKVGAYVATQKGACPDYNLDVLNNIT